MELEISVFTLKNTEMRKTGNKMTGQITEPFFRLWSNGFGEVCFFSFNVQFQNKLNILFLMLKTFLNYETFVRNTNTMIISLTFSSQFYTKCSDCLIILSLFRYFVFSRVFKVKSLLDS